MFDQTFLQAVENDPNGDGLKDELVFELSMPLADTEQVYGVTLILIFDYILEVRFQLIV